jgi:hypothetical protein
MRYKWFSAKQAKAFQDSYNADSNDISNVDMLNKSGKSSCIGFLPTSARKEFPRATRTCVWWNFQYVHLQADIEDPYVNMNEEKTF